MLDRQGGRKEAEDMGDRWDAEQTGPSPLLLGSGLPKLDLVQTQRRFESGMFTHPFVNFSCV